MPRGSKPGERRGGRQKGTPNKWTAPRRRFLQDFIEENLEQAKADWHLIGDPRHRLDLYLKAAEFAQPKLGRLELSGPEGGPLEVVIVHETRKADE